MDEIAYGDTPAGFTLRTGPGALEPGLTYEVSVHGWTRGFASIPWGASGRFVFRDGAWRPAGVVMAP
jgi:hypothetical protein